MKQSPASSTSPSTRPKPLMQQALGEQWDKLPVALQKHYMDDVSGINRAEGKLNIDYPRWMQLPLNLMRLMGALLNRKGEQLPTTVIRQMQDERQYWHRSISFPDGKTIHFKSQFIYDEKHHELIEFVNPFIGMRMNVFVHKEQLHYQSSAYVIKLGSWLINIPEYLALGYGSIIETAETGDDGGDTTFNMDFRLTHPLFGEVFSYAGQFQTTSA